MNLKVLFPKLFFLVKTIFVGFLVIIGLGCQQSPTQIMSKHERPSQVGYIKSGQPVDQRKLSKDVLVIDVRPKLNYSLAHIEGSIHLDPMEFFVASGNFKGQPKSDIKSLVQRLSQIGVDPSTQVLIVGEGKKGDASEGQLAWLLKNLGIKKIEFVAFDGIHNRRVINGDPSLNLSSKEVWQAADIANTKLSTVTEVKDFVSGKLIKAGKRVHLIDVRTEKEYFKKVGFGEGYETPNINAINVPWTEFLKDDGRIDRDILNKLKSVQVLPSDRVLVISQKGKRSSLVSFILEELGYKNVGNAIGGIDEILRLN